MHIIAQPIQNTQQHAHMCAYTNGLDGCLVDGCLAQINTQYLILYELGYTGIHCIIHEASTKYISHIPHTYMATSSVYKLHVP